MAKVKVRQAEKPPVETKVQQKVQQVPIGCIFLTEFSVLETPSEKQEEIARKYKEYVKKLKEKVSNWLSERFHLSEAEKADREKLAEAVRKADERELFSFLSDVFRKDLGFDTSSYKKDTLVATSMKDNNFNCYSATVLLAHVLTELGKEVTIIIAPGHVLLRGKEYALDATNELESGVFHAKDLPEKYWKYQEVGVETLLSITCDWCGATLHNMGKRKEALDFYNKAIELNKNFAEAWNNKGVTLRAMGKRKEALKSFIKAIKLNPDFGIAWLNKGLTLSDMGKQEEAEKCFKKAFTLPP